MQTSTLLRTVALLGVISVGALLAGCKSDAQFSNKEMTQFKEGPSKEPPPEAKAAMERAMHNRPSGPPPGAAPPPGAK